MKVREFYNRIPYPILPKPLDWGQSLVPFCKGDPDRILHAGCATGTQTRSLAYTFPESEIIALDFADSSLEIAKQLLDDPKMSKVHFKKHDLTKPLTEYGTFDLVVSYGVLHHIPDVDLVMKNTALVMNDKECPFLIFLYGKYGRANIARYQQALSLWQEKSENISHEELLGSLWKVAKANGTFSGLRGWVKYMLVNISSYWRNAWVSSNADAYLNPYVKYYNLDDIFNLLDRNGFNFGDFVYRKQTSTHGFPRDVNGVLDKYKITQTQELTSREVLSIVDRLVGPKEYEFVCYSKQ